jgi:DNA-binding protein HU-beta
VNRTELVDAVATDAGLDKAQAEKAVKAMVDVVMRESKAGSKISIFGFGAFTPTSRAARVGRNPQTGSAVNIPASNGVKFAPSTAFKALLNPPKGGARKAGKQAAAKAGAAKTGASKAGSKKTAAATKSAPATKASATRSAPAAKSAAGKSAAGKKAAPAKAAADKTTKSAKKAAKKK